MWFVFLGLIIGAILLFFEDWITKKLEKILGIKIKKFNCKSMSCYTYEGLSWVLLMYISIVPIVLCYPIVVGNHNFPGYIGLLFITLYPIVAMIFRRNTFNNDSIPSARNPAHKGPNLVTGGPGYNPLYYLLFSFSIGGASTVWGFSMLNFPDVPSNLGISTILIGIIAQSIVLFPDKINKFSPVDIRTRNGLYLMVGLSICIIIIVLLLTSFLNNIYS